MKTNVLILAILISAPCLPAQTNEPVRIALISESEEAGAATDILTAQCSNDPRINLLERNEIERVYREQALSAGNRDYLKLGQILGADGLLVLNVNRTVQRTNLSARMIAIKPGVVLSAESFDWPLTNMTDWASSFAPHLGLLLPKLKILQKDAIPIAIVNLRSAIQSAEARENERAVKLLTIQRLSQERQFFVLERQRMELLVGEKDLPSDDSPFWNGSYLLEGMLDQNGYDKDTISLNARLAPPKGGAPVQFEISASRTNLAEIINQLAAKVSAILKIQATAAAWNPADEAEQFYTEAQWALRWGVNAEAQMAADSAWALGKHDLNCALLRIASYLAEVNADKVAYDATSTRFTPLLDTRDGTPLGQMNGDDPGVQSEIRRMKSQHPSGMTYSLETNGAAIEAHYIIAKSPPNPLNIDRAARALDLYYDFSQTSPDGVPRLLPRGGSWNNWHNSDWYQLGIDSLINASVVLQDFYFLHESQPAAADKLAELRARARSVAKFIAQSPTVRDSYFVDNRKVTLEEFAQSIDRLPSIFQCQLVWGSLWQETPEDCLALYRELMASPVFPRLHGKFWAQEPETPRAVPSGGHYGEPAHYLEPPRLVAWRAQDRPRLQLVWSSYLRELDSSSDVTWQFEAKALRFADAKDDRALGEGFTNLLEAVVEYRSALLTNKVEVTPAIFNQFTEGWSLNDLVHAKTASEWKGLNPVKDTLGSVFRTNYITKFAAQEAEFNRKKAQDAKTQLTEKNLQLFERQKQFLTDNKPYDPQAFLQLFLRGFRDYSPAQALELQPLLAAYKSNSPPSAAGFIAQVQANLSRIINPSARAPRASLPAQARNADPAARPASAALVPASGPELVTNILTVSKFCEIPLDGLESNGIAQVHIVGHEWVERKLLLDFAYWASVDSFDENGKFQSLTMGYKRAVGVLDPETGRWDVIGRPGMVADVIDHPELVAPQNRYNHRVTLWRDSIFCCDGGAINKYDAITKKWDALKISDGATYSLFNVNNHLYAGNAITVFEITDDGKSSHILASRRRQPPMSALDTEDIGTPSLFEGPSHSLRIATTHKIFTWDGNDWHEDSAAPPGPFAPAISPEAVLFTTDQFSIYRLLANSNYVEFCLGLKSPALANPKSSPSIKQSPLAGPTWKMPAGLSLSKLPAASYSSSICLLVDHSEAHRVVDQYQNIGVRVVGKEPYDASLLCFSPGLPAPQKIYLKFDSAGASLPLTGVNPNSPPDSLPKMPENWMLFNSQYLFLCSGGGSGIPDLGTKPGVWLLPVSRLETALVPLKTAQLAESAQAQSAAAKARTALLTKYDRNHDGVINQDEREEALDDPAFIESELDLIDANHNGWLDVDELAYFDANQNKILDPKEQAGIDLAQHLLAEKLLKRFDVNGDDQLDLTEFEALAQVFMPGGRIGIRPDLSFVSVDANHDNHVDLPELETLLKRQTLRSLTTARRTPGAVPLSPMTMNLRQGVDPQKRFKEAVETYWQTHTNAGNNPPTNASP